MGFIRGAGQRGIRIPEEVAFVVHGRCALSDYLSVSLTTVYADLDELANGIVQLTFARINEDEPTKPQRVLVPLRLEVGESTMAGVAPREYETGYQPDLFPLSVS